MSNSFKEYDKKIYASIPKDAEAFAIKKIIDTTEEDLLCILSDSISLKQTCDTLKFIEPKTEILVFPAWDTVPYDRVSPNPNILSKRIDTLSKLALNDTSKRTIVLTSIGAVIQKLPPKKIFLNSRKCIKVGEKLDFDNFLHYITINGYTRVEQVMESGEYAIRGDIIDIFPTGAEKPLRIDLFDNEIERLRLFEIETQRSCDNLSFYNFDSANEVILDKNTIKSFRTKYRETFGADGIKDELYESISNNKKYIGMENWLPFFYEDSLPSLFDYIPKANIVLGIDVENALKSKCESIADYYNARIEALKINNTSEIDKYRPINPELMFIDEINFNTLINNKSHIKLSNLSIPVSDNILNFNAIPQQNFSSLKNINNLTVYENLRNELELYKNKKRIICCYSAGSLDRMFNILKEQ